MFLLLLNFPKTLNNWFKRVAVLSSRNLVIVTCHCERWSNAFTHLTFWTTSSGIPWFCALSYFCWLHFDGKGDCYVLHTQRIASHRIFFSDREQNILLQQHYWHCSFDLIYLWADNTHILYHFMHANGMQCENVNNRIEQTNNENEIMPAKKLIEIIMKLMRFPTFVALRIV